MDLALCDGTLHSASSYAVLSADCYALLTHNLPLAPAALSAHSLCLAPLNTVLSAVHGDPCLALLASSVAASLVAHWAAPLVIHLALLAFHLGLLALAWVSLSAVPALLDFLMAAP
eukprot:9965579-Ditylum_brightwellii.AAC.1